MRAWPMLVIGGIDDHHLGLIDANRFLDAHGGERICLRHVGADE